MELRLLGPLRVLRAAVPVPLPPSRKVRLLAAYLALAPHPVSRERLCELLWQVPDDPRGELRWCLSKLRLLLDEPGRPRVIADEGRVALDLRGCDVDALRVLAATEEGIGRLSDDALERLQARFAGDLLDGLDVEGSADLQHWLIARRSEFRSLKCEIVAEIGHRSAPGTPKGLAAARTWLESAPFDVEAHRRFLAELLRRRMIEDGDRHVEAAARSFTAEGIDVAPVRAAWMAMRGTSGAPAVTAIAQGSPDEAAPAVSRRASIAVMPFTELDRDAQSHAGLGFALTHDLIGRLARLRSLFVIARGSVFAVAQEGLGLREIGERLAVAYVANGYVGRRADRIVVTVEVAEAATSRILWTDRFEADATAPMPVLDHVCDAIVSSIAAEIETAERNRALLKPADSLDAWECFHRGLWHMYNFTAGENARAADLFRQSIRLDPTFSRAYAGLSFTHWQNAFQRWDDRDAQTRQALEAAGRSLQADTLNPAAHWAMGRALWLCGEAAEAVHALEQSVELSPNYALGHYSVAFVHSQAGDPEAAIASSDHSRLLSPCDPLLFGMLGARAMALVRLGRFEEAAEWGMRAAARPNAHVHILAIAAHCLALAGHVDEARAHAARIRRQNPRYGITQFLDTFRFDRDIQSLYRAAAKRIGLAP
jgi:DNA-binding SARP family transcriptional activator/tetratricopeptide (TPR) repeat protein